MTAVSPNNPHPQDLPPQANGGHGNIRNLEGAQQDQQQSLRANKLFQLLSSYGEIGQLVAVFVLVLLTIHIIASIVWISLSMVAEKLAAAIMIIIIRYLI